LVGCEKSASTLSYACCLSQYCQLKMEFALVAEMCDSKLDFADEKCFARTENHRKGIRYVSTFGQMGFVTSALGE
jgi:hypothetical protein